MGMQKVIAVEGQEFEVDTSNEACGKFGLKHGDRIKHPYAGEGTAIGVASATTGNNPEPDVLWYAIDGRNGRVSYSYAGTGGSLITKV